MKTFDRIEAVMKTLGEREPSLKPHFEKLAEIVKAPPKDGVGPGIDAVMQTAAAAVLVLGPLGVMLFDQTIAGVEQSTREEVAA